VAVHALERKKWWRVGVAFALVAAAYVLLRVAGSARGVDPTTDPSSGRFTIWNQVLELWRQRPVFGWGFGTTDQLGDLAGRNGMSAHNIYISVLVELGIIGVALFAVLVLAIVVAAWRRRVTGPTAASIVVLVCGVTESSLLGFGGPTALVSWLVLLAAASAPLSLSPEPSAGIDATQSGTPS
jgi:O-antigen ligase